MPVIQDTLTAGLADRLQLALAALDADAILAWVDFTVKTRTQQGQFLEGSSPDADSYRSTKHMRARQKKGLRISRVDLSFTGQMLDATKARSESFESQIQMEYGYLEGLSESEATTLATYHNDLGAGTNLVKRVFIGLSDDERATLIQLVRDDLFSNLN